jgi:hypothetical protein
MVLLIPVALMSPAALPPAPPPVLAVAASPVPIVVRHQGAGAGAPAYRPIPHRHPGGTGH